MLNLRMQEALERGEAIDVSDRPRTDGGDYVLAEFREGMDYCDAKQEAWIWSIGRRHSDGAILASTTTVYFEHPEFSCLFLR